jgi:hypothetical protein
MELYFQLKKLKKSEIVRNFILISNNLVANKHKIIMHCDGARLWNACIATGLKLSDYAQVI